MNGLADLPSYLVYLRTHAGEAGALLQDLLISVTNFFRDPAFLRRAGADHPGALQGQGGGRYGTRLGGGLRHGRGGLLHRHAALRARRVRSWARRRFRSLPPISMRRSSARPAKAFTRRRSRRTSAKSGCVISSSRNRAATGCGDAVREIVLFAPHDLLKDSPFSRLDLISCRNLLIYLNREAQSRAFDIFHFALRPGGRLFLGTSEAVDEGSPLFAVLDKKQRLYVQRPGPQRLIDVPAGARHVGPCAGAAGADAGAAHGAGPSED